MPSRGLAGKVGHPELISRELLCNNNGELRNTDIGPRQYKTRKEAVMQTIQLSDNCLTYIDKVGQGHWKNKKK